MAETNDPLKQFEVHTLIELPAIGGLDLSISNATFYTVMAAGVVLGFLALASRGAGLVPNRMQSLAELSYEFIAGVIRDIVGPEGMRFFPFVFALFTFVLAANFIGMVPIFFTTTSHLAVTITLALLTMSVVIIYGFYKHGLGFFKLFVPSGLPLPMYLLIVPIEIISFLARPITLSVRLFANMLAGHMMLKLFGGFVVGLMAAGGGLTALGIIPFFGIFAITGLEFLVAFLQAYVFAVLTVIYLNDVVNMHH